MTGAASTSRAAPASRAAKDNTPDPRGCGRSGWVGGCANWGGRRAYIVTQETFRRIEIVAVQVPTQRRILVLAAVVEVVALRSVPPLRFQPLAKPPGVLFFDGGGRGRLALEQVAGVAVPRSCWAVTPVCTPAPPRALVLRMRGVQKRASLRALLGVIGQRVPARRSSAAVAIGFLVTQQRLRAISRDPIPKPRGAHGRTAATFRVTAAIRRMPKELPVPLVHLRPLVFYAVDRPHDLQVEIAGEQDTVFILACAAVLLGLRHLFRVFAPEPLQLLRPLAPVEAGSVRFVHLQIVHLLGEHTRTRGDCA